MGEPELLRITEVAKLLNVGRTTAYSMVTAGELPTVRIGRCVRVPAPAVREWVERNARYPRDLGPSLVGQRVSRDRG